MVSHGLVTMWQLTKIPNPIWYPGTGTQVQCCVAIVTPTVFHPRLDILDPYPYPYPWYPYPWSRTRTHTHIYGLVPIPVPVPMTSSHVVPVPIPVPMVSYPYPYPYPWSRTRTRTHTHGLVPIPVPVPMIRTHTTSLLSRAIGIGDYLETLGGPCCLWLVLLHGHDGPQYSFFFFLDSPWSWVTELTCWDALVQTWVSARSRSPALDLKSLKNTLACLMSGAVYGIHICSINISISSTIQRVLHGTVENLVNMVEGPVEGYQDQHDISIITIFSSDSLHSTAFFCNPKAHTSLCTMSCK